MPWWGWVTVGALLLTAEMALVDAEFYLVFLGVAALLVGLVDLAGFQGPDWLQWLLFAVLASSLLVLFRKRLSDQLHSGTGEVPENVENEIATAIEHIAPGSRGQVGGIGRDRIVGRQQAPERGGQPGQPVDRLLVGIKIGLLINFNQNFLKEGIKRFVL